LCLIAILHFSSLHSCWKCWRSLQWHILLGQYWRNASSYLCSKTRPHYEWKWLVRFRYL
jgi:hypothetical protein